jgi:hypothetical protein
MATITEITIPEREPDETIYLEGRPVTYVWIENGQKITQSPQYIYPASHPSAWAANAHIIKVEAI